MSIRQNVKELNTMIRSGKILDAFDKYYDDEVTMVEADGSARKGKDTNRDFEKKFVDGIVEFRKAEILGVAVNEDEGISTTEWDMDFTHKDWGEKDYRQVAVQQWKDGKIVEERFYSANGS